MIINDDKIRYEIETNRLKMYFNGELVLNRALTANGLKSFWEGQKRKAERKRAESAKNFNKPRYKFIKINGLEE